MLAVGLSGCVQRTQSTPAGSVPIGPIYGHHTVMQTFTPRDLSLTAIDVRVATYARTNQGTLVMHLKSAPASPMDLRTISVPAAAIEDSALHRFSFEPISAPPSALTLVLESDATDVNDALAVWSVASDGPPAGEQAG